MKTLLTIGLGSVLGGIIGVYVGSGFAESMLRASPQVTVIDGLASFSATLAHGIGVAVAGGLIGAVLGAVLGTVSMVAFGKKADSAPPKAPPGPQESMPETFSNEPESDLPRPPTADERT